jgi:hypothetical protein
MEVLHTKQKGQLEGFHMYDLSRQKLQMHDTLTDTHDAIFVLIIKYTHHYSNPASAEVKKMWIYTSTPPYAFMA